MEESMQDNGKDMNQDYCGYLGKDDGCLIKVV